MSFCSYSKEFLTTSFTSVENQFITKYMPQSDGLPVKIYLYGLYLCQSAQELDLKQFSALLKTDEETIQNAFLFWEDYDLVRVLSKNPFTVEYLPVAGAIGRPKKVKYDKYEDFNKEMQNKMQKVGKFVSYHESYRYMSFLQENEMQQEAFLLIVQYCIDKKKEQVTQNYILNKAKKFVSQNLLTFADVEKELSGFHANENELIAVFSALGTFKAPEEGDYTLLDKWTNTYGFSLETIKAVARTFKKGNIDALDKKLTSLYELGKISHNEVTEYLAESELLASLTFTIARKLSVKIFSPETYIEEFVEKWRNFGFEEKSLSTIAVYCAKLSENSFMEMDVLVEELYKQGIVSFEAVSEYLGEKNKDMKTLTKIKSICPNIRLNANSLKMIQTWREWSFTDAMILEAAKRSSGTTNPIAYMNQILAEWKRKYVFSPAEIPELSRGKTEEKKPEWQQKIDSIDFKAERERYYATLRRKAQNKAEENETKARTNPDYERISSELATLNIALAKAKVFEPQNVQPIESKIKILHSERKQILSSFSLTEEDLIPQYSCKKCSDTGFQKDGTPCNCYPNDSLA